MKLRKGKEKPLPTGSRELFQLIQCQEEKNKSSNKAHICLMTQKMVKK